MLGAADTPRSCRDEAAACRRTPVSGVAALARPLVLALCVSSLVLGAAAAGTASGSGKESHVGKASQKKSTKTVIESGLRNTSELIGKCFDFPSSDFSEENCINSMYPNDPTPLLNRGDFAVDFVLPTLDDEVVRLRHLLKTKPVVLIYGTHTCPAFQGMYLETHQESHFSKYDQWALVDKYHNDFHFINLYSTEPHPFAPDTNFDTGRNVEYEWSTFRQPRTFKTRNFFARQVQEELHEKMTMLVDNLGNTRFKELDEIPDYNPVWCTYGPGSRMAFLIGQDGKLYNVQAWFHATTMAGAMEELMMLTRTENQGLNPEEMVEQLTAKRELAYAQMEMELVDTLSLFNQTDKVQYQPSQKSVQLLQEEASQRINKFVKSKDYTIAKAKLFAEGPAVDSSPAKFVLDFSSPLAAGVGAGMGVAALVALALVASRRRHSHDYSKVPDADLAI